MNRIIIPLILLVTFGTTSAQVLDNSFGTNGIVVTPGPGKAQAITRQPDGKLITAGYAYDNNVYHFQLIRYNNDGTLDNGFGTNGKVNTEISFSSMAQAVIVQPDGKILAGGTYFTGDFVNIYHAVVVRYHANGTMDSTFGIDGKASPDPSFSEELTDMALQPDGKIVIGGAMADATPTGLESFMVARFNSDGTLDTGFGTSGVVTTMMNMTSRIADIALLPDGKIIAAGQEGFYDPNTPDYINFALVKYKPQGTLDSTFGTNGMVITDVVAGTPDILQSMVVQADGKIIAGGSRGENRYLVRYQSNGSLDNTFGSGGKAIHATYPAALHLALKANGKIISAGTMSDNEGDADFLLHGYLQNGNTDSSFGSNGVILKDIGSAIPEGSDDYSNCLLIEPNGKIVVAGYANGSTALMRFTDDDVTSINKPSQQELDIDIYPNPVKDVLNIQWKGSGKMLKTKIVLVNMLGQKEFTAVADLKSGNNKIEIPNFAAGNYILLITADDGRNSIRKITKK